MQQQPSFGGVKFNVGQRYQLMKLIGAGAYGHVVLAYDTNKKGFKVAIKKLSKIEDDIDAKRVLREIKIQKSMDHPNILKMFNIVYDQSANHHFGDIYLITKYFPADLSKIIKSGQELTVEHLQYIMYQLSKGLNYLHSASILHRDIKPGNILATEDCDVCYCDFGLARKFEEQESEKEESNMTEYVVTSIDRIGLIEYQIGYYRAPEIMLSSQQYSKPVDVWSLGCTFAELITGKVLFKGQNYIQMVKLIFETLGKPTGEDLLELVNNESAQSFVDTLPDTPKQHISNIVQSQSELALHLLDSMLQLNPRKRIKIQQVLEHPFFEPIRDKNEEITFEGQIDCSFELDDNITLDTLKRLILQEISQFQTIDDIDHELNRLKEIELQIQLERLKSAQLKKQSSQNL